MGRNKWWISTTKVTEDSLSFGTTIVRPDFWHRAVCTFGVSFDRISLVATILNWYRRKISNIALRVKKKENCKHSSPIRDPVYRPLFKRYALQCISTACKNKYDPVPRPKYQTKRRISPPPLSTTIQLTVASDIIFTKRIVKSFLK